ncbi:MAG: RNA methyltransferase [Lachnospiraceae bacterium]|nr:RNA methyltransferase [Lachnospiraceae bacterium]
MARRIDITDIAQPEVALYNERAEVRLKHYFEPAPGLFIAESARVALRALSAGYRACSLLIAEEELEKEETAELITLAGDVPLYVGKEEVLDRIAGYHLTRGVLCACYRKELPDIAQVLQGAKRIAVLEEIGNPTNAGAIFRNAAALGIDALLLTAGSTNPFYRRAVRVSMGTVFTLPFTFTEKNVCPRLKESGFTCVAAALRDDALTPEDPAFHRAKRLALFLGTENAGLSADTVNACDHVVKIPMQNDVDSLNVAAASAVLFYALCGRFPSS